MAVKQFINGVVKGINPAFAPTAPQFVNQMRANAEYNAKIVAGRQQLLEQFREQELDEKWASRRTPEAKAKVQSMIDAIKAEEKADKRTPEEVQKAKDDLAKQDQFFAEQFIESPSGVPVSKSLAALMGVTTYNTADDDKYDMGQMK